MTQTNYTCEQARLAIGAEPQSMSAELAAHVAHCADCSAFRADTLRLDTAIHSALQWVPPLEGAKRSDKVVSMPVGASGRAPRRWFEPRRWAMAASVTLGVALAALLWTARPDAALAADVVAHMAEEPDSWGSRERVPDSALAFVLRKSGVRLTAGLQVTYAHSCYFRGQWVPHLVVQTTTGPVTVLIVPGETVAKSEQFAEDGYTGVLVPGSGGVLAVLSQGAGDVAQAARDVQASLAWEASNKN
jgi:hypothetical protein